jgi:hypothetical protein
MDELQMALAQPFAPSAITWKPGSTTKDGAKCMAMAYADLRAYQERLDQVCGMDWSVRYAPWGDGRIICELTIGGVTRSSTGEMDAQDEKNGMGGTVAEAQAMKRAAAQFGLGRYLYDLPSAWVEFDPQRKRITDAGHKELDNRYAAWYARQTAQKTPRTSETTVKVESSVDVLPESPASIWETPAAHAKKPDTLSAAQLQRIHILGKEIHGEAWAVEGPKMVSEISNGATSSKQLTPAEAAALIRDLEAKRKQTNGNGHKQAA